MKNFQIILIVVFIAAAVIGVLIFSGAIPLGGDAAPGESGTVVLWGTFPAEFMNKYISEFNGVNQDIVLKYEQKSQENFDNDLLEALASGIGPDMFFLPDDLAFHYKNKILMVPYTSYSLSAFKNNFVSAGEVFLTPTGFLAFPIVVDPLVMYYNRGMLEAEGIVNPPANWDDFVNMVPKLTKRDETNKIIKSASALGHYSNITHAKDILAMLFMQTGSRIVSEKEGRMYPDLAGTPGYYAPAQALAFYTDFADPQKNVYSWNKSFPMSRDFFSTNNLAFYFGYATELSSLFARNPNQNFLAAPVPQIKGSNFKLTGARVTGLAISAFSRNQNTAFLVASELTRGVFASELSLKLGTVPARRDLLKAKSDDPFAPVFYDSALYSKSWLDPAPSATDDIFRRMIDGVLSNNFLPRDAIADASAKMTLLLNN